MRARSVSTSSYIHHKRHGSQGSKVPNVPLAIIISGFLAARIWHGNRRTGAQVWETAILALKKLHI